MDIPDDIPQSLIDKADCVIVYPTVLKAAFIVGVSYGRGVMSCRSGATFHGPWSAPSMMALEGASFGFQAGGQATDFVILVMNTAGANAILASKVKLGGDASVAAGPVGRNAAADTDVTLRAEMLTYSRSRGLFAGISLAGSTVRPDNDANTRIYGKTVSARDIVLHGAVRPTPDAKLMLDTSAHPQPQELVQVSSSASTFNSRRRPVPPAHFLSALRDFSSLSRPSPQIRHLVHLTKVQC